MRVGGSIGVRVGRCKVRVGGSIGVRVGKCGVRVGGSIGVRVGRSQGIYNRPGIKCKNGRLEIASQIIDRFYFVDQIFAQFFLLDKSCIYSAHVGT